MDKLYYSDRGYYILGKQEEESFVIPNYIPIKNSIFNIFKIILTPESHKVVSINYYFSSNSFFLIDNEFIIENTKKLILQEKKNNMNFFSKIINNIFKPKNDLYEQITNIKTDFENSET